MALLFGGGIFSGGFQAKRSEFKDKVLTLIVSLDANASLALELFLIVAQFPQ
tara:strand:- start:178 stop:333 length:156 start_codon:yes stop_codon:yes gene_type:complete